MTRAMLGTPEVPAEEPRLTEQKLGQETHRLYGQALAILRRSHPFLESHFDNRYVLDIKPPGVKLVIGDVRLQVTFERSGLRDFEFGIEKQVADDHEKISLQSRRTVSGRELVDVGEVKYRKVRLAKPSSPGEFYEGTRMAVERVDQFLDELEDLLG